MKNDKVRVLYFVDRLRHGGIQQLLLEILKHIDKDKVQIDLLVFDDGETYPLEETVRHLGINLYKLDGWIKSPFSYFRQKNVLDVFFKEHYGEYKAVHLNSSSKNFLVLREAKKYRIPMRIAHAHSGDFLTKNPIKKIMGNILKKFLIMNSTDFFACSNKAGRWLFGDKIVSTDRFHIINNAIDIEKYKYSEKNRLNIRKNLNIDDDITIYGHVGRLTPEKNHKFLVDVFKEITKINDKSILLLIGIGQLEHEIKKQVENLGISSKVIFGGFAENVNEYLSAMDVFIFTSTFEGLGLVLIEAQANGLKCYASKNAVPNEAKVSEQLEFIELDKGQKYWAEHILKSKNDRCDVCKAIEKSGYKIENMCKYLESFYTSNENSI